MSGLFRVEWNVRQVSYLKALRLFSPVQYSTVKWDFGKWTGLDGGAAYTQFEAGSNNAAVAPHEQDTTKKVEMTQHITF